MDTKQNDEVMCKRIMDNLEQASKGKICWDTCSYRIQLEAPQIIVEMSIWLLF